jgi:redox-regulated HSP33 family molecular chaperone
MVYICTNISLSICVSNNSANWTFAINSIQVVKDVGMKDYFSGASPIVSGELGDDFTYYYATSEQTPSSVGLGL